MTLAPTKEPPSHTTSPEVFSDQVIDIFGGRVDIGEFQFPVTTQVGLPATFPKTHAAQAQVEREAGRFNVICCGRRWGKTEYLMRKLAEPALAGQPVAYFTPTYDYCEAAYTELVERLEGHIRGKHEGRFIRLNSGGSIRFWSMQNGGDRARGRKYKRVCLDEVAIEPSLMGFWQKVVRPTLADMQGDAWFASTPRRGGGFQLLFDWKDGSAADAHMWRSWRMPTSTNPFILPEEIENMRAGLSQQAFMQEVMADFEASDSELVYPEFGKRHIGAPSALWSECKWRIAAIDPGGGDPTACYLIGVDKNEHINVYAPEFYRRGDVTPDMLVEFVSKADSVAKVQRITIGETGGNLVTNHFRRAGLPAVKADMAKGEGIEYVRWALQNNLVTVDPKCENMIAEFGMYRWAQKKDPYEGDRYATSIPGDRHGDAMDALRYGIFAIVGNLRGARPMVVEQARQQRAAVR
jgi:hypothetical protein